VHEAEQLNLGQIKAFLKGSEGIRFEGKTKEQIYSWIEKLLVHQQYHQQGRAVRGLLRQYVEKITGMSRAQVTRLIARFGKTGQVRPTVYQRHRFAQRYTARDVELLVRVDEVHETLSGPATRHILEREYQVYGKREYERLASIFRGPSVQPAQAPQVPSTTPELHQDAIDASGHRRAAPARSPWTAWVLAGRHRPSRR
jgi:hypothetical protein